MISAIIHTYNEEKNIERVLLSLTFADEIIVADMGSTDRTVQIAKVYHAKIYTHPYTGFVEPARNFAVNKAMGDWILIVDADEEIPGRLAKILKSKTFEEIDYVRIPRKNLIFSRWIKYAGWWPDYQVRFFKKGMVSWTEKIHGVPLVKGTGVDLDAIETHALIHYNYQSIEQFISRMNRYTSISAKEQYLANKPLRVGDFLIMPAREFATRYFAWAGYKDGVYGLALSLLQAVSEFIAVLKLWELSGYRPAAADLSAVRKSWKEALRILYHGYMSEMISQNRSRLAHLIMRVKGRILKLW